MANKRNLEPSKKVLITLQQEVYDKICMEAVVRRLAPTTMTRILVEEASEHLVGGAPITLPRPVEKVKPSQPVLSTPAPVVKVEAPVEVKSIEALKPNGKAFCPKCLKMALVKSGSWWVCESCSQMVNA
jgi:hypothetical protein